MTERVTPSQTVGPFFSIGLADATQNVLVPDGSVRIVGQVLDGAGDPVPDAVVELWQPGADGTLWGRCGTDAEGAFEFVTEKPAGEDGSAPSIDVLVFATSPTRRQTPTTRSSHRSSPASARRSWRGRTARHCASTFVFKASSRRCSLPFEALFVPAPLRAAVSDAAWLRAMLEAERALAVAEAKAGVISQDEADAVVEACDRSYDVEALAEEGRRVGNLVEPLVRALRTTAERAHWGATSQDILDTAMALVAREAKGLVDA